jgi:hypothetical protein
MVLYRRYKAKPYLQVITASFHILSNSLFINNILIWHYIVWATKCVIK